MDVIASLPTRRPFAAVVVNPLKTDVAALKSVVSKAERAAGWGRTLWIETSAEDAGQGAVGTALRRGASAIAAAGGDGTVRAVAEALRGSGVPLALLPVGTANLFARNLGHSMSGVVDAVRVLFDTRTRQIDLGMVEVRREGEASTTEHAFLVVAGLGLDAKMIRNTSSNLKKAVGWLAYVDGITRSLPQMRPVQFRYSIDDGPSRPATAHSVLVGNCGMLPGGFLLMPEARLDDGILDIAVLRPRGPFGWLKVWNTIAFENGVLRRSKLGRRLIELGSKDVKDVVYRRGRQMSMQLTEAEGFQLDGEDFGEVVAVRVWVEPGALVVKVP